MNRDPFGALLDEDFPAVPGAESGALAGATFVVKDLFAVAGRVTGAGQPTWAATHDAAREHALAVRRLLDAGATLVGRSHTSEMAYSLSGRDNPYGMPVNPAAPTLDPGGSSSGSAAAVAGGLADLGLGTDTLGSVRVPASYCGLFGWRPTHGVVPPDGVHPLAESLDTVGLLARDPQLLGRGAEALTTVALGPTRPAARVSVAAEAFALLDEEARDALLAVADSLDAGDPVELTPDGESLADLVAVVRDVQGPEFATAHGAWIDTARPIFGEAVGERVAHALQVTAADQQAAGLARNRLRAHLAAVLGPDDVVLCPAAGRPPRRDAPEGEVAAARRLAACLSVVGSLAGLPTVTIPAAVIGGAPLGLSLLGARGADGLLLRLAAGRPPVPPASRPGAS